MRLDGLRAVHKRRCRVTTQSTHKWPVAPNVLGEGFESKGVNQKWQTDITFVPTDEGWLFFSPILDLYARMIVGWAMEALFDWRLTLTTRQMVLVRQRHQWAFSITLPRRPVCQRRLSGLTERPRHAGQHEPARQCL